MSLVACVRAETVPAARAFPDQKHRGLEEKVTREKRKWPQKRASHPIRATATPRHRDLEAQHDGPRAQAANAIDRSNRAFPLRPAAPLPPFPRRTQERACSSAPAPGSDTGEPKWPDHSMHSAERGLAVAARGLRGRQGRPRTALPCMSCGDNRARVPPRGPCSRPPRRSPRFPWAKRSETAKGQGRRNQRGVGSPATSKVAALFRPPSLPLLPFGLWQRVRSFPSFAFPVSSRLWSVLSP